MEVVYTRSHKQAAETEYAGSERAVNKLAGWEGEEIVQAIDFRPIKLCPLQNSVHTDRKPFGTGQIPFDRR
jgi:hypothetical protein